MKSSKSWDVVYVRRLWGKEATSIRWSRIDSSVHCLPALWLKRALHGNTRTDRLGKLKLQAVCGPDLLIVSEKAGEIHCRNGPPLPEVECAVRACLH